jgi:hypothetical protein
MAVYSQDLLMDTEDVHESDVIEPKFNGGGLDKFQEYIHANFDFKKVTKPGKMVASFSIDTNGQLKDIRITEFVEADAAAEYIRVLMQAPKWQSARRAGKPFSVKITLPLIFK